VGFAAGSLDPPLKIHATPGENNFERSRSSAVIACMHTSARTCVQTGAAGTRTRRTHTSQAINGLGGVLWFIFFGRGRLVAVLHTKDDCSDPPMQ
jgi:hypothetical protein